jgi:hypothetical protein
MAVAESVLVLTDEDGNVTRAPVLKSAMIKFERRYRRTYTPGSVIDAASMAFYLTHEERWPGSDAELEDWFDSIHFDVEDVEAPSHSNGNGNEPSPLEPSAQSW